MCGVFVFPSMKAEAAQPLTVGIWYYIRNMNSGLYLDVPGGATGNYFPMAQWHFNGDDAEQWMILAGTSGNYYIVPKRNTNQALDVYGGSTANGTQVGISTKKTGASSVNQQWYIVDNDNGSYSMYSTLDYASAIEIPGGSSSPGASVNIYYRNYTRAQQWVLERAGASATIKTANNPNNATYGDKKVGYKLYLTSTWLMAARNGMARWTDQRAGVFWSDDNNTDVNILEYSDNTVTSFATTNCKGKYIRFNLANTGDFNENNRIKTATHECGHALGLAEYSAAGSYGAIMRQGKYELTHLSQMDIAGFLNAQQLY